jgi:hypothetical protein
MQIVTNLEHILIHIEADAPCSLFHVAAWVETQLNMPTTGFISAIDNLVAMGIIEVTQGESGLVVDLA